MAKDDRENNVTPEAVQELTRELVTSRRAIAEAQGVHRSIMKRAKGLGVNTKALTEYITNRNADSDEVIGHYRDVMRYAAINGAPYALQQDLFPTNGMDVEVSDKAAAEHNEWEATQAGHDAGRLGQAIDACPFAVGSPLAQMWQMGWHRGQAAIAHEMAPGETAPTSRRRRSAVVKDADAAAA